MVLQCSLNAWLSSWLAEISADLWEALYKSTYFTFYFFLHWHCFIVLVHRTGTVQCLHKEMATCRHWSVSLRWDSDDVPHCQIHCRFFLTKLNSGLSRLHSADEVAVSWLTNYGSWHAYEKKKKWVTVNLKLPSVLFIAGILSVFMCLWIKQKKVDTRITYE